MQNISPFKKGTYGHDRLKRDRRGEIVESRYTKRNREKQALLNVSGSEAAASLSREDIAHHESPDLHIFDLEREVREEECLEAELGDAERVINVPVVSVEEEDDEDDAPVEALETNRQGVEQQLLEPLHKAFVLAALLKWIKFHGTKVSLAADLKSYRVLIESITGKEAPHFPSTLYQLQREVASEDIGLKLHYICREHGRLVGSRLPSQPTNISFVCGNNDADTHVIPLQTLSQSSLLTTDIETALRSLLPKKWSEISRNVQLRGRRSAVISEFVDGAMYADFRGIGPGAVTLLVHPDGARLAGSSSLKCYAIHYTVAEMDAISRYRNGILHTMWVGPNKDFPHRSVLWRPFLDQMARLSNEGMKVEINGELRTIYVYVACVVGDSMERFPLAGLSVFHAEFGCTRCPLRTLTWTDPTKPRSHHQIYPCVDMLPANRTDAETQALAQELMKFHPDDRKDLRKLPKYMGVTDRSPIHELRKLDIIRGLPIGFMHLFLKGLYPKVLEKVLSPEKVRIADSRTAVLNFPNVISRKPRSLAELSQMKANEFCTFMIYGLYSLHEVVSGEEFETLALLTSLATTVTQNNITGEDIIKCKEEAKTFVVKCQKLWGDGFLVSNVHLVLHLHDCIRDFGTMAGYCELAYEDWIGKMLKTVKGFNQIPREFAKTLGLRHATNRLTEFLQKENLPENVRSLLDELSHTKKHKIAVELGKRILLGASRTLRWLENKDPISFCVLRSLVALYPDVLDNCSGQVFDKIILKNYLLSNRTSFADENANALFYDRASAVYEFRYAVQYFRYGSARGPTFIIARKSRESDAKPYSLDLHLPIFSVVEWTQDASVLESSEFGGVAVEMPYGHDQKVVCKLPRLLFSMD